MAILVYIYVFLTGAYQWDLKMPARMILLEVTYLKKKFLILIMITTTAIASRAAHTYYRMQGSVILRGGKNVGRQPCWCRPNAEHNEPKCSLLYSQLRERVNNG